MTKSTITVKVRDNEFTAEKRVIVTADVTGTVSGFTTDEVVKLVNYAEDLKVRAAVTSANTDNTGKETLRLKTMAWAFTSDDFKSDVMGLIAAGNKKNLNAYLDDLYTEESAKIDAPKVA